MVPQVAWGPAGGGGSSGSDGGEDISLVGTGRGVKVGELEDKLAPLAGPFVGHYEGHEGGDVRLVVTSLADETGVHAVVDGAGGDVVVGGSVGVKDLVS